MIPKSLCQILMSVQSQTMIVSKSVRILSDRTSANAVKDMNLTPEDLYV